MPFKPAKYGIKLWWACDSKTAYPFNGQIYTGKVGNTRDINQGERVLKDLITPYKNTGCNVTTDDFLHLAEELLTWKMSIVGTLKKISVIFQMKHRPLLSTEFGFGPNIALCSYVPNKDKAVVLLSTLHPP